MNVTKKQIEGFRIKYKEIEGVDISDTDAHELLVRMLTMFVTVYHPLTVEDIRFIQNKRKEIGLQPIDESLFKTIE